MHNPLRKRTNRKTNLIGGFTLIEVMLVIAIVGILATVTVPRYQGVVNHYHLESASQVLANQIRYAKQRSMDVREDTVVICSGNTIRVLDKNFQVINQSVMDSGVQFDQSQSLNLQEVLDPVSHTSIGWGLSYNKQGFAIIPQNIGGSVDDGAKFILVNLNDNQSVSVNVAVGTGIVTYQWQ